MHHGEDQHTVRIFSIEDDVTDMFVATDALPNRFGQPPHPREIGQLLKAFIQSRFIAFGLSHAENVYSKQEYLEQVRRSTIGEAIATHGMCRVPS